MNEIMLCVCAVCMVCALYEQMLDKTRYFRAVRLILGFHILAALLKCLPQGN